MDRYLMRNLQLKEDVLLEPKLHWSIYIDKYFNLALFFAVFFCLMTVLAEDVTFFRLFFWHSEALIGGLLLLRIIYIWLKNSSVEMAVTNYRVIYKIGILNIRTEELEIRRVESAEVRQSFLGRLLNYGDILFSGTGTSKVTFHHVCDPWRIKKSIEEILRYNG